MSDNDLIRRGQVLERLELAEHDAEERDWRSGANEIARLRKYVAAIPAAQPTVKPLAWRDDGTNGHETDHAFGFYEVYPSPEGDMLSRDGVDSGVFPTIEAAKAAAQADYAARILSALDMQPTVSPKQLAAQPDDVAALVEALEWYISEDETNEGDKPMPDHGNRSWNEINSYWIEGKRKAEAALARVKGETK